MLKCIAAYNGSACKACVVGSLVVKALVGFHYGNIGLDSLSLGSNL